MFLNSKGKSPIRTENGYVQVLRYVQIVRMRHACNQIRFTAMDKVFDARTIRYDRLRKDLPFDQLPFQRFWTVFQ